MAEMHTVKCWMVRVGEIVPEDEDNFDREEAVMQIECGDWLFPCPDFKYTHIRDGLLDAVKSILHLKSVELKSFSTGIVDYDIGPDEERLC